MKTIKKDLNSTFFCLLLFHWSIIDGYVKVNIKGNCSNCNCEPNVLEIECSRGKKGVNVDVKPKFKECDSNNRALSTVWNFRFVNGISLTSCPLSKMNDIFDKLGIQKNQLSNLESYFFDNQIYVLPMDLFLKQTNLSFISFSSNNLHELPDFVFNETRLIHFLQLSQNHLSKISANTFFGLEQLEELYLRDNTLQTIHKDAFKDTLNLRILDLQNNKLEFKEFMVNSNPLNPDMSGSIFKNAKKLRFLNLSWNKIRAISANLFFNCSDLQELYLNNNKLEAITNDAFKYTINMEKLDLSSNQLITEKIGIDLGLLRATLKNVSSDKLQQLKNCDLNGNAMEINLNSNNTNKVPVAIFKYTPNIEWLDLSHNSLQEIPAKFFFGLNKLGELSLENNTLQMIHEDTFKYTNSLRVLSLNHNQLEFEVMQIENNSKFQNNPNKVDVWSNNSFKLPKNIFNNLNELLEIGLSYNHIREISAEIFSGLKKLQDLYLDNNKLEIIHNTAFNDLIELQTLDLNSNYLKLDPQQYNVPEYLPFKSLDELTKLDLRNNSLNRFPFDLLFYHKSKLSELDLSENYISSLNLSQIIEFKGNRMRTINLSNNRIKTIHSDELNEIYFIKPKSIWIFKNNPLQCDCKILQLLDQMPYLESIDVILNDMKCISPPNLRNRLINNMLLNDISCPLGYFGTDEKKCPHFCKCSIRGSRAVIFNCSNANLTEIPLLPIIASNEFSYFKEFELIIENNSIVTLPNIISSSGYEKLTKISVRNNLLKSIEIENLPINLTFLDVSYNKMQTLDANVLQHLNESKTKKQIQIEGNPWSCDCDKGFIHYIQSHSDKIINYNKIKCIDGEFLRDKAEACPKDATILISVFSLIAFLGLSVGGVIAFYYIYQQEIKIWLYAHNYCMWTVTEEKLDKDKIYDVFISFSYKDEEFIRLKLLPELENGPNPLKTCLHLRDWMPGDYITRQISRSILSSRRTIIVLSKNFLESEWARMEFRVAHKQALDDGRIRVIIIIYGEIGDTEQLDTELNSYLKTNTYIKWGDPNFFNRLRYALPHTKNRNLDRVIESTMQISPENQIKLMQPLTVSKSPRRSSIEATELREI